MTEDGDEEKRIWWNAVDMRYDGMGKYDFGMGKHMKSWIRCRIEE
jgi:hypothetical protein